MRRANPPRLRISAEEALAAVALRVPPSTPGWAADLLAKHDDELRCNLGIRLTRGESVQELGAFVVDVDAMPGGRALMPAGGTLALGLDRADLVGVAARFDERLGVQVHEFPPSATTIPVMVVAAEHGTPRALVVPVELSPGVDRG